MRIDTPEGLEIEFSPAESLDDLVERALIEALISTIPSSPNVSTHFGFQLPAGESLEIELP